MLTAVNDAALSMKRAQREAEFKGEGDVRCELQLMEKRCSILHNCLLAVIAAAHPTIAHCLDSKEHLRAWIGEEKEMEHVQAVLKEDQTLEQALSYIKSLENDVKELSVEVDTFQQWKARGVFDSANEKVLHLKRNPTLPSPLSPAQLSSPVSTSKLTSVDENERKAEIESLKKERDRAEKVKTHAVNMVKGFKHQIQQTLGYHIHYKDGIVTLRPEQVENGKDEDHQFHVKIT
mmetsp:Transcript_23762/g.59966  ORF Transcript_23762/g.59966 Transcript_23762/m.59966 type:complete len:234 (-) Transcript_23762:3711-4412(-)